MKRKTPVNVAGSVRPRLLKVSKERREDFTLTLTNYAAERFLYRLSRSTRRDQFILKGAMLFAVRIGEQYRATRDLDLLGTGAAKRDVGHAELLVPVHLREQLVVKQQVRVDEGECLHVPFGLG